MPDPRNHVRSGQPLALAAEQVNWINRQMRAHPELPGASLPHPFPWLVIPCRVATTVANVSVGYVVKLNAVGAKAIPDVNDSADKRVPRAFSFDGEVVLPVTLNNYEDAKHAQLGVIVGGTRFSKFGTSLIVDVCIAGMCVARVRQRSETSVGAGAGPGPFSFMSAPVKRNSGDTDAKLTGAGEASSCGRHRVIAYLGDADTEGFLKFAAVLM